ncbi:dipeptidase [Paratissierella segnis]|jgi:membrane dipeptidase|uniref:Membrane dipeptidase n=1 Tax=Paratissierella segnis TaxID=2763679 RepID=A0A926EVC4_9FIRM|nr:dipeptidase [Paratissierella segnis]MBC8586989.1 membrane dipeptidase [Paratissierella segnis]
MRKGTEYKGYKAYSYLEAGKDYPVFEFADWNWAGEYLIPLSETEEERVQKLAQEKIFIALHEHPALYPKNIAETAAYNTAGREFCAYEALSKSYLDCVFDNMMDGTNTISSKYGWKWRDIIHDLGMRLCDLAHQDFLIHCKRVEDIYKAHEEGKIAWVAVIEGAAPIENELDRIDILYGLGVRQLGITYSESNALGNGLKEDNDGGLTKFGKQAVERMNKVGMLIDVSHCGPKTAFDSVVHSQKPIIASHVGARALWDSKRLFHDDLIKAIAEKGGVIGVESAPHTTMTKTNMTHDIESVMEHFEYIANLVGIDHVSFGIDSLYGDHVGLHHVFSASLSKEETSNKGVAYDEVEYVKGLENPTEASWNILRWLVKHNYSDEDIEKVIGGNALRVLKEVWK